MTNLDSFPIKIVDSEIYRGIEGTSIIRIK